MHAKSDAGQSESPLACRGSPHMQIYECQAGICQWRMVAVQALQAPADPSMHSLKAWRWNMEGPLLSWILRLAPSKVPCLKKLQIHKSQHTLTGPTYLPKIIPKILGGKGSWLKWRCRPEGAIKPKVCLPWTLHGTRKLDLIGALEQERVGDQEQLQSSFIDS